MELLQFTVTKGTISSWFYPVKNDCKKTVQLFLKLMKVYNVDFYTFRWNPVVNEINKFVDDEDGFLVLLKFDTEDRKNNLLMEAIATNSENLYDKFCFIVTTDPEEAVIEMNRSLEQMHFNYRFTVLQS